MKSNCIASLAFGASTSILLGLSLEVEYVHAFVQPGSGVTPKRSDPLNVFTAPEKTTATSERTKEASGKITLLDKLSEKIGNVEDERIVFPEYESGEVTRMFSALQYSKSEQGNVLAQHSTGSVFGAAALVAGTMCGAGVLALPTATASVGFLPSTVAMGIGWVYMTMSGLLIAELSLNRMVQSGKPGPGMLDLYQDSLGKWGKIGSGAYFFLHYAVMVAYLAQGGVNLDGLLDSAGFNSLAEIPGAGQIAFTSALALSVYAASPSVVEKANNVLVMLLAATFLLIIGFGASTIDFGSLIDLSNQHPANVVSALPVIFLSLVYHNIVPTVVNQLEGDRSKITKAIIAGTSIPTIMFLGWNAVVLGNVQGADLTGVDPVALLQAAEGGNPVLGSLVGTFSSLALVTSLIGFTYGLLDAWTDVFRLPTEGPTFEKWKAPLFFLIFLPPLALSVTDPDIFYRALDLGGAFGVSTLFLALPPLMVWSQRYGDEKVPLITKPMGK